MSQPSPPLPLLFRARTVTGSGRGRNYATPTLNLALADVPTNIAEGIYACRADVGEGPEDAVLHYGPRPVFADSVSCEVHILDRTLTTMPAHVEVELLAYLREVRDFPSPEAMYEQIASDVRIARGILAA